MDSIMQIYENRNEMYGLISAQQEVMDRQTVKNIESSDMFSMGTVNGAELAGRMNAEQNARMAQYQSKQLEYQKEFDKLGRQKSTAQKTIKYYELLIQMERNDMEMRLLTTSVLGKDTAAKQIRAESLGKIRNFRKIILDCFDTQIGKGRQTKHRNMQAAEFAKEEAAYQEAAAEHNLRVLTAAALAELEETRRAPEDSADTIRNFLQAEFSPRALEADYVIQNLADCLRNVELIRCAEELSPAHREDMTEAAYEPVKRRLEEVREYTNAVESVLWEYGLAIDYDALQIREINENDEAFAKRRRAYLENGALRFYLGIRRTGEDDEGNPEGEQGRPMQTRVEAKLDALEAELGVREFGGEDMRVTRAYTRSVNETEQANAGDRLRAAEMDYRGKQEHQQIKIRLLNIFETLMQRFKGRSEKNSRAFQYLEGFIREYVLINRETYENRSEAEKREAEALSALEEALVRVHKFAGGESGRYAAILHGLLLEESSGYLEAPPDQIYVVRDEKIGLGNKNHPDMAEKRTYRDCKNMPLFTHRPNIKDIEQGNLGDCYLLAGLIAVVDQNAEEIMNIMKDNGDGTVTVCFRKGETEGTGDQVETVYTSYYITVEKTVPVLSSGGGSDAFSRGALWVKMMEKAYAASGFHLLQKKNEERKKEKETPQKYQDFLQLIQNGTETLDYDDIGGGQSGEVIGLLLGKKSSLKFQEKNRLNHLADQMGRRLPPIHAPAWSQSPIARYGNESADSIYYEFLVKKFGADMMNEYFLALEKPVKREGDDEDHYDELYHEYKIKKGLVEPYIKDCMIFLDIVDTLVKKVIPKIWELNDEAEVLEHYDRIIAMFEHYKRSVVPDEDLSGEDKIIADVKKNYGSPAFNKDLKSFRLEEFADIVNILRERHLSLLRNGRGIPVQAQDSDYSAKDRKLYEKISTALAAGAYVTFGTRKLPGEETGMNGESEEGGLVGTHAYAILNTRKKIIGGKEYLFFVVMNPWAEKGVIYDVKTNGIRERAVRGKKDGEREEGVFLLELKRFADVVKHWDTVPVKKNR